MTAAVARLREAMLERRSDERWAVPGLRDKPVATMTLVFASVALHAGLMAFAALTFHEPRQAPQQEIAVEIVQEAPKSAAPAPPPVRPVLPPAPAPKPAPPPAESAELKALKDQLASLKAEHDALEAAAAAPAAKTAGQGPMAGSFQAIALPAAGAGDGDAVAYRDIVFSALAKAKGVGQRHGLPGTAGVSFEIDAAGRLVDAAVVVPSGIASLDSEALDIVRRAAPFPAPPEGAQRTFVANVNFVVQTGP